MEASVGKQKAKSPTLQVAETLDADIFILSGPVERSVADDLIKSGDGAEGRDNCALILTTHGGDPDAAFIMARHLKRKYKKLTLYVFGHCKSAGTLLALGADEIVMGQFGELGPLDVQLFKQDEIMLRNSGLDIFQALHVVSTQAFFIFERHFLELKERSHGNITTKTAAQIATNVAARLLQPITAQIDPLRLGEMQRAVTIAKQYGDRLGADSEAVHKLIYDYPSHSFVIDIEEAEALFPSVRGPSDLERGMERTLRDIFLRGHNEDCLRTPHSDRRAFCGCLTKKKPETQASESQHVTGERVDANSATPEAEPGAEATVRAGSGDSGEAGEPVPTPTSSANGNSDGDHESIRALLHPVG